MITPFRLAVVAVVGGISHLAVNTLQPFEVEEPACVAAENWVQAHPEALTPSYADFSAYDVPLQKAIYSALDGETRIHQ